MFWQRIRKIQSSPASYDSDLFRVCVPHGLVFLHYFKKVWLPFIVLLIKIRYFHPVFFRSISFLLFHLVMLFTELASWFKGLVDLRSVHAIINSCELRLLNRVSLFCLWHWCLQTGRYLHLFGYQHLMAWPICHLNDERLSWNSFNYFLSHKSLKFLN